MARIKGGTHAAARKPAAGGDVPPKAKKATKAKKTKKAKKAKKPRSRKLFYTLDFEERVRRIQAMYHYKTALG